MTEDPAPATAPLMIVLTVQRPVWVRATTDGHREIYRILTPGPPARLTAAQDITIRVGDAGALTWRVNGRDAGLMGRPGQVRDLRVTPANAGVGAVGGSHGTRDPGSGIRDPGSGTRDAGFQVRRSGSSLRTRGSGLVGANRRWA